MAELRYTRFDPPRAQERASSERRSSSSPTASGLARRCTLSRPSKNSKTRSRLRWRSSLKARAATDADDFVDTVLTRVAELTKEGEFDEGSREVDGALAELDRPGDWAAEAILRSRNALLETDVKQDILRRDFRSAAARVGQTVELLHDDHARRFESDPEPAK